jgi:hypothetical protein
MSLYVSRDNNRESIANQQRGKQASSTIQAVLSLGSCKMLIIEANFDAGGFCRITEQKRSESSLRNWQLQEVTRKLHSHLKLQFL